MTKIEIAKKITNLVVQSSVSYTVGNCIKSNCTPTTKTKQVEVVIGAFIISGMVGEKAGIYIDRVFDDVFARWINLTQEENSP